MGRIRFAALALFLCICPSARAQNVVTTVAGGGPNNLPKLDANLVAPTGLTFDTNGNLYVVDQLGFRVYKIDGTGQLTVVAGNGLQGFGGDGGPAVRAQLYSPCGAAVDHSGNVFVIDGSLIREIVAATGIIQTAAGISTEGGFAGDGGPAISAQLNSPKGIFIDGSDNIFIADTLNNRIREILASTGVIQTVAGGGGENGDGFPATSTSLNQPMGLAVDPSGSIFFADSLDARVREVNATTGVLETVAGGGVPNGNGVQNGQPATSAVLSDPTGVAIDGSGNLFITDHGSRMTLEVSATTKDIQIIAGAAPGAPGGSATSTPLGSLSGIVVDSSEEVFITDLLVVYEVVPASNTIQVFAGNESASFSGDGFAAAGAALSLESVAGGLSVDGSGSLFIADTNNGRIREVSNATEIIDTVAGGGTESIQTNLPALAASLKPKHVSIDANGNIFFTSGNYVLEGVATTGNLAIVAGNASSGSYGDGGPAIDAALSSPTGLTCDTYGNIFVVDAGNSKIREIVASTGAIQTVAGSGSRGYSGDGGLAINASIIPGNIFVDRAGNLFIAEGLPDNVPGKYTGDIREVFTGTGIIQTVVGNGNLETPVGSTDIGDGGPATSASLYPSGVYVDGSGNIFIADQANFRIREVLASSGIIQSIAGNGVNGFSGDGGSALNAQFGVLGDIGFDPTGNLYVVDTTANRIREISGPFSTASVPAPSLSQTNVSFGDQAVGTASAAQSVTLANPGSAVLLISSISLTGANSADFEETNKCGTSIAAGSSCAITVSFSPSAVGAQAATVTISDNAIVGTQRISLSGTGTPAPSPSVKLSPVSLTFTAQLVSTTSTTQSVSLTNNGTAALAITSIVTTGASNSDFSQANNCGSSLPVGASCMIGVTFTPSASGARSASITITDSATNSPQTLSLSGDGLTFALGLGSGSSTSAAVTAGQTANYTLALSAAGAFTSDQVSVTLTCTGVPAGATCIYPTAPIVVTSGTGATVGIAVITTARSLTLPVCFPDARRLLNAPVIFGVLLACGLILVMVTQSSRFTARQQHPMGLAPILAMGLLVASMLLAGCSRSSSPVTTPPTSPSGTQTGTYTISVAATAATVSHTISLTLTVQ
jgi:trimeric autotransporter adhesin